MSLKLRDLIKQVRATKTQAEEREAISKECAKIRTSIKEEQVDYRQRNIAKLLYIHMLGYPTQFGQMECLKLTVSPHYSDKRLGYLALMLLLDEKQEVLMLATNSLKSDLFHPNHFVVGLSLCTLANIASAEISRDTCPEVEKLLQSTNSYIRKKAALCATRIIRKVPDLIENFIPKVRALLSERNHGVLITGVTLMIEICQIEPESAPQFKKLVPSLVRILKSLVLSGYAPDHDVGGITDPFLQVKILRLLRLLAKGDAEASEQTNDILAQVATNTENVRNVGNAILYECVQTIMTIEAESGLRILAINVLGRFLLNRDNNIRYVALNTLSSVVSADMQAVQRHRDTIVDCLKDPDVSIRRRALDLIYALVNENNVKQLIRELLNFLVVSDVQFRADLVAKLCVLIEKFSPTKSWQIDTTIRVMSIAGNTYLPVDVPGNLIAIISQTPDIQAYAVQRLYLALVADSASQPMTQIGVWCIGEYGDLLVDTPIAEEGKQPITVSQSSVLDFLEKTIKNPHASIITKEYVLTTFIKLTNRNFQDSDRIQNLIKVHEKSAIVEIQQRACEFSQIFKWKQHSDNLLGHMPAFEAIGDDDEDTTSTTNSTNPGSILNIDSGAGSLIEGFGGLDVLGGGSTSNNNSGGGSLLDDVLGLSVPSNPAPSNPSSGGGLLDDLLGSGPSNPVTTPASGGGLLDDLLGAAPSNPAPVGGDNSIVAFNKDGITTTFQIKKDPSQLHLTMINAVSVNNSMNQIGNFTLQVAVPPHVKLQLDQPSGTQMNTGGSVSQIIKCNNTEHGVKPLAMKLRIAYGNSVEMVELVVPN